MVEKYTVFLNNSTQPIPIAGDVSTKEGCNHYVI